MANGSGAGFGLTVAAWLDGVGEFDVAVQCLGQGLTLVGGDHAPTDRALHLGRAAHGQYDTTVWRAQEP